MSHYMYEFLGLMAVFSIMIVSPGADFAIVVRQSIVHGRRSAIMTSFGIGASLLFHISYTILGLGLLVSKSLFLFGMLKWAGAAYLFSLGIKALRAPGMEASGEAPGDTVDDTVEKNISDWRCFLMGFV
ncbi:LysE family translocator, partial [Escherichia coli]|nr:LysE family translocator [Escherichia coli]